MTTCANRYPLDIEPTPVTCDLAAGHEGAHEDSHSITPAFYVWAA